MIKNYIVVLLLFSGLVFGSFGPLTESVSAQGGDPVFVGAGDIANCNKPNDEATAKLLDGIAGTVFTVGDNAYPDGTLGQFNDCYGPSWGRHKDRTRPVPGNHDYHTDDAAGYFDYFGAAAGDRTKGYYSYNLGAWHIIALNSEIDHLAGSAQEKWLRADLAANQSVCTLAYWHKPRFSSGKHGNVSNVQPFWKALYEYGADVVLNGHDHTYERFAPQNPSGQSDPGRGIREFIVGTGGAGLYSFGQVQANSEVRNNSTWGVLKLTLHSSSYDWQFVPVAGQTFTDSGNASCVGTGSAPAATQTSTSVPTATQTATLIPTATYTATPMALEPTATSAIPSTATGMPAATQTPLPISTESNIATPTANDLPDSQVDAADPIFADDFETGNLSAWSSSKIDSGDLSVSTAAALSGANGLQAVLDDNNSMSVTDERPTAETRYRVRFYFDPNSIAMASGDVHNIFNAITGTASKAVMRLQFRRYSGTYQLRASVLDDGSSWRNTNWFAISDMAHFFELDWQASAAAGANTGSLMFWIDGAQVANLAAIDNDQLRIERAQLGPVTGLDAGTRGTYFFDAFESRRLSYIGPTAGSTGPIPNTPVPGVTPTSTAIPVWTPTAAPLPTSLQPTVISPRAVVAFPGAEGFGAKSVGGRGGRVIEVTNLNDSGPGSFRECVTAQGPRICVFRIGGTITVQSRITVSNPYLTIAGQTAPGGGITLRAAQSFSDEPLAISTHDVIIRYMRFRAGASALANSGRRSLTVNNGAYNVILDHCSFSWATDQPLLLIDGVHDTTVQWSIISEGLANSTHYEGGFIEHSTGLSVSGKNYKSTAQTGNITIHHNLIAHNGGRNPQNAGYGLEDIVNNVIYNWKGLAFTTHDLQANVPSNVIKNYFKAGVNTTGYEVRASHTNSSMTGPRVFVLGNLGPHRTSDSQAESNIASTDSRVYLVSSPFPAPAVTTTTALQAYADVLARAGVRIPTLDAVDKRILEEVKRGEGKIVDCVSAAELSSPINCAARIALSLADYTKYGINDPLDAKGWPVLAAGTAPADSDHDGMPDSWETAHGLNPSLNDSAQDRNEDGYTNIEEYINGLAPQ